MIPETESIHEVATRTEKATGEGSPEGPQRRPEDPLPRRRFSRICRLPEAPTNRKELPSSCRLVSWSSLIEIAPNVKPIAGLSSVVSRSTFYDEILPFHRCYLSAISNWPLYHKTNERVS